MSETTKPKTAKVQEPAPVTAPAPLNSLAKIQALVKAPKGQFNSFGKYKYRSAEDILEAVKPVVNGLGFSLTISDQVILIGSRFYIKATVTLTNGVESYEAVAYAREEESKKGMDGSQITGATSSYARKYALSGLLALDDTKDADATNTHDEKPSVRTAQPKDDKEAEDNVMRIWQMMLDNAKTLQDLMSLYSQNKETVDANPDVKILFTNRKKSIENVG